MELEPPEDEVVEEKKDFYIKEVPVGEHVVIRSVVPIEKEE